MVTDILVKDAMVTEVVTARPDQTVVEGADTMRKKDVGCLVICEGSKIVGIVTREDMVNKIVSKGLTGKDIKLSEIMSKNLVMATGEEDLGDAARKMSKYGFERLPVVEGGKLVGIISDREVARICPAAIEILRERLLMEAPASFEENTDGDCDLCGNYSDDLMSVNSRWACPECREEAAEL
ncbi:MAG: CBS domain-containing protein [Nanoarchaeota archaeon]|nr:CBS domain-containing protein [Nanoarchaeota archaeon]